MKQREIKFRALDKVTGRMYMPDDQTGPIFYLNGCIALDQSWVTGDFLLMQYTGMKDQYGVEVYEGDIVRYKDRYVDGFHNSTVVFEKCGWRIDEQLMNEWRSTNSFEVIGNIHQNPDLLK